MTIVALEPPIDNELCKFEINGNIVFRVVHFNKFDGLYITYKGKKFFESEFSYFYPNNKED